MASADACRLGRVTTKKRFFPKNIATTCCSRDGVLERLRDTRLKLVALSFKTHEEQLLVGRNNARPVGVCVGRGGRIFVTIAYMDHNEESPIYRSDLVMITRADDSAAHPFDAYDIVHAKPEKLWEEISDPSWGRRFRAHLEILRRGGELLNDAERRLAACDKKGPAVHHLIWLAAAAAAAAPSKAVPALLQDGDPVLRAEAIRAMTEYGGFLTDASPLSRAIEDPDPRVQHAALLACFPPARPLSDALREAIVRGPARSADTYLRQTAAFLLAERCTLDQLQDLLQSDDAAIRLAGILSAGFRLTMPPVNKPPRADLPLAKCKKNDQACMLTFADGKSDLRSAGRTGTYMFAEHWKAGSHSSEQERLFAMLLAELTDASDANRLEATFFLRMLNDPRSEPEIDNVRAAVVNRRLAATPLKPINAVCITGPFADNGKGMSAEHEPERGPIDLGKTYQVGKATVGWSELQGTAGTFDLLVQIRSLRRLHPSMHTCGSTATDESGLICKSAPNIASTSGSTANRCFWTTPFGRPSLRWALCRWIFSRGATNWFVASEVPRPVVD